MTLLVNHCHFVITPKRQATVLTVIHRQVDVAPERVPHTGGSQHTAQRRLRLAAALAFARAVLGTAPLRRRRGGGGCKAAVMMLDLTMEGAVVRAAVRPRAGRLQTDEEE